MAQPVEHFTMQRQLKALSWNINGVHGSGRTNIPHQKAFTEHYSLKARWPKILTEVIEENPDIGCVFEISRTFLEMIETDLKKHYTTVKSFAYAPNQVPDTSFYFTLFSNIELDNLYAYSATSTPFALLTKEERSNDSVLKGLNEGFEKTLLVAEFHINEQQYVYGITHYGLRYPYQQLCSDMFSEYLHTQYPKSKIFVTGDFNTFPTADKPYDARTLEPFEKCGLRELVGDQITFCGFPDDFGLLHTQDAKDNVASVHQFAENTDNMEDIRKKCAETIFEIRNGLIASGLDRVLTNIPSLTVSVKLKLPSNDEFVQCAAEGKLCNLSDHACIIITFNV